MPRGQNRVRKRKDACLTNNRGKRQAELTKILPDRVGKNLRQRITGNEEGKMHFGGIGTESGSHVHRVTECMHEHTHFRQDTGGARVGAAGGASQVQQTADRQETLSLSAYAEGIVKKGKNLLKGIWGGGNMAAAGENGEKTGTEQVMAQVGHNSVAADGTGQNTRSPNAVGMTTDSTPSTPQIAAAATAVQTPQIMESNPYFAAVEEISGRQNTVWQRIKVRFKDVAGQLAGHLPGKFSGSFQAKNSFHARQEPKKQDLRKHSRFRRDEVEIDCVLTDDSYLMDSYDRKGEYSKLSAKK